MKLWLQQIESELQKILPLTVDRAWVDRIFGDKAPCSEELLFDTICDPGRTLVYRGGKRWRPLLMLLMAKMLGGEPAFERALSLVSLVELPHNGSLIIDDIEDQSEVRRGKPAIHITHGVDLAINAGSMLFFLPTLELDDAPITDAQRLQVYQIYAKYMRKIHIGQGMDIVWHHSISDIPDIDAYETMCRLKTGCLAAMGAEIGAAVGTDDEKTIVAAGKVAETIGLGFQILDDVINLEKGNPGKNQGDDIVENKKSLPIILYAQQHPKRLDTVFTVFEHAQSHGYENAKPEIMEFINEITASGVLDQAREHAHQLFQQVEQQIVSIFPPSEERDVLFSMVQSFIDA